MQQDAKEKATKVIVEGLTANMPEGYVANKELQEQVHGRYVEFTNAVKEDLALAGLGEINEYQVDSILVGSMVHQYFGKGKFEKVYKESQPLGDPRIMEGQKGAPSSDSGRLEDQRIRGPFDQTAVETIQYRVQPDRLNTTVVIT